MSRCSSPCKTRYAFRVVFNTNMPSQITGFECSARWRDGPSAPGGGRGCLGGRRVELDYVGARRSVWNKLTTGQIGGDGEGDWEARNL